MIKLLLKRGIAIALVSTLLLSMGCDQIPVRNPFQGRQEPKLGQLPSVSQKASLAKVDWSNNALAKQEPFTKLIPHVSNNVIYAADHAGKVVALDRHSGKKLWSNNTTEKFIAGPTVTHNMLLLTTKDAKVVALDKSNGHALWQSKIASEVLGAPAHGQGIVLVHAIDGSVSALKDTSGEILWHVEQSTPSLTLHFTSAPAIAENVALVGFANGKLLAFNLQSGLIEWERTITTPRGRSELQRMVDISADPLVEGNKVYVITYQGKLAAVNTTTGDLLWERELSSYQNMAMDSERIFVTDNSHHLWAIDRETGATLWKLESLAQRYITGPAVLQDKVVVGDRGGFVHVIATKDGRLLDHLEVAGKFYQGPVAIGNQIVMHSNKGKIAAVTLTGPSRQT